MRLGFNNVNGIPGRVRENSKVAAIQKWIKKFDVDGFFGVKSNLNWKRMPQEGKLQELAVPFRK